MAKRTPLQLSAMLGRVLVGLMLASCAGAPMMFKEASSPAMVAPEPPPPPPAPALASSMSGLSFSDSALLAGRVGAELAQLTPGRRPSPAPPHGGAVPGKPAAAPETAVEAPATTQAPAPRRESLLIYTATLVLAVYQVDASLTHIEELARTLGGYLASRTDAAIVVRIPRARFQEALAEVAKVGDVLHREVEAQDVSDQVVDLEARLKNARAVRDRLAQLLQGATATKDALEIEKELARVMGDIEVMEGKLQLFADKIAYSTVTVRFQPLSTSDVHVMARLPFPWLQELGLGPLLQVK